MESKRILSEYFYQQPALREIRDLFIVQTLKERNVLKFKILQLWTYWQIQYSTKSNKETVLNVILLILYGSPQTSLFKIPYKSSRFSTERLKIIQMKLNCLSFDWSAYKGKCSIRYEYKTICNKCPGRLKAKKVRTFVLFWKKDFSVAREFRKNLHSK